MLLRLNCLLAWGLLVTVATASRDAPIRCIMYLTGQHVVIPSSAELKSDITHVILAFMTSGTFLEDRDEFPLFTSVADVRPQFTKTTKIMVAIGGWGDAGFEEAARDETSRKAWAMRVKKMVDATGADGIDIDWEYPGGNRDDYKRVANSEREWEIEAYVQLLQELRAVLGSDKILSLAVPGLERDLIAFTSSTTPRIVKEVDFINVMTYDLMNRRDTAVKHHSGVIGSGESIQRYIDRGAPPHMLNLGFGYYVKWFKTVSDCDAEHPVGCATQLLEDPETGDDLGGTAGFSWHDEVPTELSASFTKAVANGKYYEDETDSGFGYWDAEEQLWWSFDTPDVIAQHKFPQIVKPLNLGGVFAWGLGEDAPKFANLKATVKGMRSLGGEEAREEL